MENNPLHISIVIIGYNTKDSLKKILEYKKKARDWVVKNHDLEFTVEKLYKYYNDFF